MSSTDTQPDETTLLRALVALQVAERQDRSSGEAARPSELVLADAGVGLTDIAALTGRKYESVKTTVRRAREASAGKPPKKKAKNG
jgi:DNA-directed RNA polymerase specialized sigma24 family protein